MSYSRLNALCNQEDQVQTPTHNADNELKLIITDTCCVSLKSSSPKYKVPSLDVGYDNRDTIFRKEAY